MIKRVFFTFFFLILVPIAYAKPIPKASIDYPILINESGWTNIKVNIENIGDDAKLSGGVHIEVSGADIGDISSDRFLDASGTSPRTREPLCEINGTQQCYGNLTAKAQWFEVLVKDLESSEKASLTFQIRPNSPIVRINYRSWIPDINCRTNDTSQLREGYKQYWRNDECIERDPNTGNDCDVNVYAAHFYKRPYKCYSVYLFSLPNWVPLFFVIFIPGIFIFDKNKILVFIISLFLAISILNIKDYTQTPISHSFSDKLVEASLWLKNNSPQNSIVITTWAEAPIVYSSSERGIILGTRVYPSEANKAGERLKDISTFFFSENEEESFAIANKYNATHAIVFERTAFRSQCNYLFDSCPYITKSLDITNKGERTTYGKMILEGNLRCFKLVHKNSEVMVYQKKDFCEQPMIKKPIDETQFIISSADWLAKNLNVNSFDSENNSYEFDPVPARMEGSATALIDAYMITGDKKYFNSALEWKRLFDSQVDNESVSGVSSAIDLNWELYDITGSQTYLTSALGYTNILKNKWQTYSAFLYCGNCSENTRSSLHAITSIQETYSRTHDPSILEILNQNKMFLKDKIATVDDIADMGWMTEVAYRYGALGDDEMKNISYQLADELLDYQHTSEGFPTIEGSFWVTTDSRDPSASYTGRVIESLYFFKEGKYRKAADDAVSWLSTLQFTTENTTSLSPELKEKVMGGILDSPTSSIIRIDNAFHLINALMRKRM